MGLSDYFLNTVAAFRRRRVKDLSITCRILCIRWFLVSVHLSTLAFEQTAGIHPGFLGRESLAGRASLFFEHGVEQLLYWHSSIRLAHLWTRSMKCFSVGVDDGN